MSIHDEVREMLPAYAIGALDRDEAAKADAHLASCDSCPALLEEYRSVAAGLAVSVPVARPPRNLKARTMHRALSGEKPSAAIRQVARAEPPRFRSWFVTGLVTAALVFALAALGMNVWQDLELGRQIKAQRDMLTVLAYEQGTAQIVRGTNQAPDAVGRLYLDIDSSVAALVTVNMPPLPANRVYQVWLTAADGHKASGGVFQVDPEGNGLLLVRAPQSLNNYAQVGVTPEPAGGSSAPTAQPVLLAQLSPR